MNASALWVMGAAGIPCGARELSGSPLGPAPGGRTWLDVCMYGQHLPQLYGQDEAFVLAAGGCERLGLCPGCLGFGDLDPEPVTGVLAAARGIDQVREPCPDCGGSGRPAMRVTVTRGLAGGTTGTVRVLPHSYIPAIGDPGPSVIPVLPETSEPTPGLCLACVSPRDARGPRGEALHS